MTRWDSRKVGELVDFHNNRRVPLSKRVRADRRGPFPYYGAQGIVDWIDDYRFDGNFLLVAEDGENLRSRKQPVARLVDGQFWVNNHAHVLSPKLGAADGRFLMHALNQTPLSGRITGAAQPKLTKANLADLEVKCPNYEHQLRISSILAAFDELININERRIELLEQTTRSLYRNWFINLRFPSAEPAKVRDTSLGKVPADWSVLPLSETALITMGQSARSEEVSDTVDGPPFHQGVSDFGSQVPNTSRYCASARRHAEPLDTLCSVRAPVGRLNVADQRLGIGRGLAAIRRRDGAQTFLRHQLRQALGEEDSIGGGTIYKAIGKDQLSSLPVVEPDGHTVERFERMARPMLTFTMSLVDQNRSLRSSRDLLLPSLVTGQLDISDVDLGILAPTESG